MIATILQSSSVRYRHKPWWDLKDFDDDLTVVLCGNRLVGYLPTTITRVERLCRFIIFVAISWCSARAGWLPMSDYICVTRRISSYQPIRKGDMECGSSRSVSIHKLTIDTTCTKSICPFRPGNYHDLCPCWNLRDGKQMVDDFAAHKTAPMWISIDGFVQSIIVVMLMEVESCMAFPYVLDDIDIDRLHIPTFC